tara:strand:- start:145 stop:711 length:567 start_codon:yes stop_codon:yes gene_type:complete
MSRIIYKPVAKKVAIKPKAVKKVAKKPIRVKPKARNENSPKYDKRIKQLKHIISDNSYIPKGSTNSYHNFIFDMYLALVGGRKITPKMESAITKIVINYAKHLRNEKDPNFRAARMDFIENSLAKLNLLEELLIKAKYSKSYEEGTLIFLNSISEHVKERGNLTLKQRKALNKMHKRFNKRIEKLTKN